MTVIMEYKGVPFNVTHNPSTQFVRVNLMDLNGQDVDTFAYEQENWSDSLHLPELFEHLDIHFEYLDEAEDNELYR